MASSSMHRAHHENVMQDIVNSCNVNRTCVIKVVNDTQCRKVMLRMARPYTGEVSQNQPDHEGDIYDAIQPCNNSKSFVFRKMPYSLTGCSGTLQFKIYTDPPKELCMVVGFCNKTVKIPNTRSYDNIACVGLYSTEELNKMTEQHGGDIYKAIIGLYAGEKRAHFVLRYSSDGGKGSKAALEDEVTVSVTVSEGDHCNIVVAVEDHNPKVETTPVPPLVDLSDAAEHVQLVSDLNRPCASTGTGQRPKPPPKSQFIRKQQSAASHNDMHAGAKLPIAKGSNSAASRPFRASPDVPSTDITQNLLRDLRQLIEKYSQISADCEDHQDAANDDPAEMQDRIKELLHELNAVAKRRVDAISLQEILDDLQELLDRHL